MKNKTKSGFTLVELIVVIAILGIIVLITLPKFQQYVKQAEVRKELANAKTVETAAMAYDESNNMVKDPSGDSLMFYNWLEERSLLQPYLSDDIKMVHYGWDVNEPGEYAVYKTQRFFSNPDTRKSYARVDYMVYYFDPRVGTRGSYYSFPQTMLLNGEAVVNGYGQTFETDEYGNQYIKYMTVEEYLAEKAQEEKN